MHDCAQFVAAYFEELTGAPATDLEYRSEHAAMRLIARHGSLRELVSSVLGKPRETPPEPGDIVLSQLGGLAGDVQGLGIYNGAFTFGVLPNRGGVARYSGVHITDAWKPCRKVC